MAVRTTCVAVLLAVLPLAGCGTIANRTASHRVEGGPLPFGGVHHDLDCIRTACGDDNPHGKAGAEADPYPRAAVGFLCAVDLPFSLVADTVLWPYTRAYNAANRPVPYPPITIGATPPLQGATAPVVISPGPAAPAVNPPSPAVNPPSLPAPPAAPPLPLPVPPITMPPAPPPVPLPGM